MKKPKMLSKPWSMSRQMVEESNQDRAVLPKSKRATQLVES
jgi:hypothetical protein